MLSKQLGSERGGRAHTNAKNGTLDLRRGLNLLDEVPRERHTESTVGVRETANI